MALYFGTRKTHAQSICTHYSCFENMGRFVTLKKNQVQNMDLKKAGCKNQGNFYSKREETRLPLLFLNNNDPAFCNLLFSGTYFGPDFFSLSQTDPCFQNKNSGWKLTGRWAQCMNHCCSILGIYLLWLKIPLNYHWWIRIQFLASFLNNWTRIL